MKSENSCENVMNNRVTDLVLKMFFIFYQRQNIPNYWLKDQCSLFIEFYLNERTLCETQHDKNEILG